MTDRRVHLVPVDGARLELKLIGRGRLLSALAALACTGTAGAAVTIKTVVNNRPAACADLLAMVKSAGVPNLSDAQLCDFRFSRLPPAKTKNFTFPVWTEMPAADPSAMYFRLLHANFTPDKTSTYGYPWPDLVDASTQAAADRNLASYQSQLSLQGKGAPVTFVEVDVRHCSTKPYMKKFGVPYYAVFDHRDLSSSKSVKLTSTDGTQIALWQGRIPVGITIDNRWIWLRSLHQAPMIQVTLNELVESSSKGPYEGLDQSAIRSYGVCAFTILNTTKPHKELRP